MPLIESRETSMNSSAGFGSMIIIYFRFSGIYYYMVKIIILIINYLGGYQLPLSLFSKSNGLYFRDIIERCRKYDRIVVYSQDIQRITGRSERYAQTVLKTIKKDLGKKKHQLITWQEFCAFGGLDLEDIRRCF
jgi:hypothetical protein